jgi:hypothetical protein
VPRCGRGSDSLNRFIEPLQTREGVGHLEQPARPAGAGPSRD